MPFKPGNGIRTLDDIRSRCMEDPLTDCWIWPDKVRMKYYNPHTGKRMAAHVRRAAFILAGRKVYANHLVFPSANCAHPRCCNPEHSREGNYRQWGESLRSSGKVKMLPSKCAAAKRTWNKRGRSLTPEDVQMIRASEESNRVLAKKLGVSRTCVWMARTHKTHRGVMSASSVFTWRG